MCRALYELMEDEIREREKRAEEIGEQRGEKRGEERGEKRGEKRGEEKMLISLVKDGLLSSTEAIKRLSITEEELEQKLSTV